MTTRSELWDALNRAWPHDGNSIYRRIFGVDRARDNLVMEPLTPEQRGMIIPAIHWSRGRVEIPAEIHAIVGDEVAGAINTPAIPDNALITPFDPTRFTPDLMAQNIWRRLATTNVTPAPNPATQPNPANHRTPEQEARWRLLNEEDYDRGLTPEEGGEYAIINGLRPCLTPIAPRVRVKVWYDNNNSQWYIRVRVNGVDQPLPPVSVIKGLLPPAYKGFLPSRVRRHRSTANYLVEALQAGLPAQALHDALKAWFMARVTGEREVDSITPIPQVGDNDPGLESLLRSSPMTVEVGGRVFKLTPIREIDSRPLIQRIRQRTVEGAKVEALSIKTRAQSDARTLVQEAEIRVRNLRDELDAERARAGSQMPDWIRACKRPVWNYDRDYWCVEIYVSLWVREIRLLVNPWERIIKWNPLPVAGRDSDWYNLSCNKAKGFVTISRDGSYILEKCSLRDGWTTHMISGPPDSRRCCMNLQGLPNRILSVGDLRTLENGISRGMQVVNLNSPLSSSVESYDPRFKDQLPEVVKKWFRRDFNFPEGSPNDVVTGRLPSLETWIAEHPSLNWDASETIRQEAQGVFNVDDPVPVIPPVTPPPMMDGGNIPTQVEDIARLIAAQQEAMIGNFTPDMPTTIRRRRT